MKIFHKGGGGGGGGRGEGDYESRFPPHSFVSLDISYSGGGMRSKKQLSMCECVCFMLWRGVTVSHIYKCRKRTKNEETTPRLLRDTVFYSAFFMRE